MYNDIHASSYRRLFRIVTADMENWKSAITVCIDTDDMRGANENDRLMRAIKRMGRIQTACRFMVGGGYDHVKMYDNADGNGKTLVYRNKGYYVNIGA